MHHKKEKRHTVPNSNYPSFPFYQEEIELKTNLIDNNNNPNDDEDEDVHQSRAGDNPTNDNDIEFCMHDKLKMCFSEMQNIKDHFDKRRRRFPSCKKKSTPTTTMDQTTFDQQESSVGHSQMTKNFQSTSNQSNDGDDGSKFKAHLIRTRSRDSIDDDDNVQENPTTFSRQSNAASMSNKSKRSISDPYNLLYQPSNNGQQQQQQQNSIFPEYKRIPTFQSMRTVVEPVNQDPTAATTTTTTTTTKKQQGFNEWLSKLEEINDMSRSTIDRIRRLENDIFALRNTTEKQMDSSSSPSATTKTLFTSKIPIHSNESGGGTYVPPINNRIRKRSDLIDKSQNTDIDMTFMNKLLKYWETHSGYPIDSFQSTMNSEQQQQRRRRNSQQLKDPIRRLTTTISRSVKIQTDSDGEKSFEEKGVTTDDDVGLSTNSKHRIFNDNQQQKSKLNQENNVVDLPTIIEKPMVAKTINTFHVCADNKPFQDNILIDLNPPRIPSPQQRRHTPEPIVEMYSDSDDTYFDDFEKDIFNEISRRALIRNKIISRSRSAQQLLPPTRMMEDDNTTINRTTNSSTQTQRNAMMMKRDNHTTPISAQKGMHSTSKIIIERKTHGNQSTKREVIIQTDIDHDGKVRRTTEIRNTKHMLPMDMIKIENECFPPLMMMTSGGGSTNDKKEANDDDDYDEQKQEQKERLQRRQQMNNHSILMTDNNNDDLHGKTDDDFLSNKAFSSLDISSSSPPPPQPQPPPPPMAKSPVTSEGYHSERLLHDSSHSQRQYLIEPPESFRQTPQYSSPDNIWVMNNETLIENVGNNEMNITTKASTTRKPTTSTTRYNESPSSTNEPPKTSSKKSQTTTTDSRLIDMNYIDDLPQSATHTTTKPNVTTYVPTYRHNDSKNNNLNECKFSIICNNNGTNIVFRADFGINKLPMFETNL
ncbi:hypothetical protein HUG17_4233 [Dermatophagoides farinae]|uniref:Uncharacterized protein n=1 Tax=Dermatophagoides farinae TaxID=6954 RepID=A0A9D4NYJ9_DERFA|nr:hypothetical protein HUG17_4233 [Dermatophagoides farinae]